MFKKAILGGDGAVTAVRMKLVQMLESLKVEVVDCGHCADFPDAAKDVSLRVTGEGAASFGVLICGSGTGVSIAANKVPGIRAAFCHDHLTAKLARAHNNANVLCMGARTMGPDTMVDMLETFVNTPFEGGRHEARVNKMMAIDRTAPGGAAPADAEGGDVYVSCDHAAWQETGDVVSFLRDELGIKNVVDMAVHCGDRVDYPDKASVVCKEVVKSGGRGVLLCGSGIGVMMAANKHNGIRAALCHEAFTARAARVYTNANVLCMGARTTGPELHKDILRAFFAASYDADNNNQKVKKMMALEQV